MKWTWARRRVNRKVHANSRSCCSDCGLPAPVLPRANSTSHAYIPDLVCWYTSEVVVVMPKTEEKAADVVGAHIFSDAICAYAHVIFSCTILHYVHTEDKDDSPGSTNKCSVCGQKFVLKVTFEHHKRSKHPGVIFADANVVKAAVDEEGVNSHNPDEEHADADDVRSCDTHARLLRQRKHSDSFTYPDTRRVQSHATSCFFLLLVL
jgi:hypothetical protein